MSKHLNQSANEALDALEKIASEDDTGMAEMCKSAGFGDGDTDFVVKFARAFDIATALSTEDLVKRALRRFVKDRNADAILNGIKRAAADERTKCAAACSMVPPQDLRELPEDAALLSALEKRAVGLGSVAPLARRAFSGASRALPGAVSQGSRGGLLGKLMPGLALSAGGIGAWQGAKGLYDRYGAPAGRREALQSMAGNLGHAGDVDTIINMMRSAGEFDPGMLDVLQRALARRRNPWVPSYWS